MINHRTTVGQKRINSFRDNAGFGYIIIPIDVDREQFIANCKKSGNVSILNESSSEIIHRVPIGKTAIKEIEWPASTSDLGSVVGWINHPIYKHPFIVDIYHKADEYQEFDENILTLSRTQESNNASVVLDGKNGSISLYAYSDENGEINIDVKSGNDNAKLNISVNGDSVFSSKKKIQLKAGEEFSIELYTPGKESQKTTLTITDSKLKVESDAFEIIGDNFLFSGSEFKIDGNKIIHNNGSQPMVKGSTLVSLLNQLINLIATSTTATMIGPQPLINAPAIANLATQTENIKSSKSNLD